MTIRRALLCSVLLALGAMVYLMHTELETLTARVAVMERPKFETGWAWYAKPSVPAVKYLR